MVNFTLLSLFQAGKISNNLWVVVCQKSNPCLVHSLRLGRFKRAITNRHFTQAWACWIHIPSSRPVSILLLTIGFISNILHAGLVSSELHVQPTVRTIIFNDLCTDRSLSNIFQITVPSPYQNFDFRRTIFCIAVEFGRLITQADWLLTAETLV